MSLHEEGWYRDPYELHEDRWFSDGQPTKLVRDDGQESYDEPPDRPVPVTDLVRVPEDDEATSGSDLRRADEASNEPPYSAQAASRAAFDAFDERGFALPPRQRGA